MTNNKDVEFKRLQKELQVLDDKRENCKINIRHNKNKNEIGIAPIIAGAAAVVLMLAGLDAWSAKLAGEAMQFVEFLGIAVSSALLGVGGFFLTERIQDPKGKYAVKNNTKKIAVLDEKYDAVNSQLKSIDPEFLTADEKIELMTKRADDKLNMFFEEPKEAKIEDIAKKYPNDFNYSFKEDKKRTERLPKDEDKSAQSSNGKDL